MRFLIVCAFFCHCNSAFAFLDHEGVGLAVLSYLYHRLIQLCKGMLEASSVVMITLEQGMWKVSVCVHDCEGTQKNMACRTRHGAGVMGSAQRPHVAPRPARCGGRRPACCGQGARPAARRGVGEAPGSAGDSRVRGGAGGGATGKGALYFLYTPSGYLLVAEVAADRTYATWKAVVDERLKALGTAGLSLLSDRAKALIQRAATGFECLSMPDFFHCIHDLVKRYSLALGQRRRHAQQELMHAETSRGCAKAGCWGCQAAPALRCCAAGRTVRLGGRARVGRRPQSD